MMSTYPKVLFGLVMIPLTWSYSISIAPINQSMQIGTGVMNGIVSNPDLRPAARVSVTALRADDESPSTHRSFSTVTDDNGRFSFPLLPAGNYRVRVDSDDSWLIKNNETDVVIGSGKSTTVKVQLRLVEICDGNPESSQMITDADYSEIVKSLLEEALINKKIPSYVNVASDKMKVLLSTAHIRPAWVPTIAGHRFILLTTPEIESRAHRQGQDLMYLEFGEIKRRGSCVSATICSSWADGTSTLETGKKTLLGEGCLHYLFRKVSGKWIGTFAGGSVS